MQNRGIDGPTRRTKVLQKNLKKRRTQNSNKNLGDISSETDRHWVRLFQDIRRRIRPSTAAQPGGDGGRNTEIRAADTGSPSDPVRTLK